MSFTYEWNELNDDANDFLAREIPVRAWLKIKCDAARLFNFITTIDNWPLFGFHGVLAARHNRAIWYLKSQQGDGYLFMESSAKQRSLTYFVFFESEDLYEAKIKLIPTRTCTLMVMMIKKPRRMPARFFAEKLKMLDTSLGALKEMLETSS